jgi:hypothetical protein
MKPSSPVVLVQLDEATIAALRELPVLMEHLRRQASASSILSLREAARRAKRRTGEVSAALKCGALPATRNGRNWRVRASDLDLWAQKP